MTETSQFARNVSDFTERAGNEIEEFRWQREKVELITHIIAGLPTHRVLADVGCFTGITTEKYRSLGFSRVVGFGVSPDALHLASKRGIEDRRWIAGETPCPAEDSEFDVIVA